MRKRDVAEVGFRMLALIFAMNCVVILAGYAVKASSSKGVVADYMVGIGVAIIFGGVAGLIWRKSESLAARLDDDIPQADPLQARIILSVGMFIIGVYFVSTEVLWLVGNGTPMVAMYLREGLGFWHPDTIAFVTRVVLGILFIVGPGRAWRGSVKRVKDIYEITDPESQ